VRGLMYFFIRGDMKMKSRVKNFISIVFSVKFCVRWYQIHLTQSNGLDRMAILMIEAGWGVDFSGGWVGGGH